MDQGMRERVTALRAEAFATFKALDDAVVSLGGERHQDAAPSAVAQAISGRKVSRVGGILASVQRLSQTAAAEMVLRERNVPTTGADLMEALPSKGVSIGGANPVVNFTSAMSKSDKFRSIRRGGNYYWWFKDTLLPPDWNDEAPDFLPKEGSDASLVNNQEGGDGHGPATT